MLTEIITSDLVSTTVEQQMRVGDCHVEIHRLEWNTPDYVPLRQDRCCFSLTLGVPRGLDRGHWRIGGFDHDVETGHCGALEASTEVEVRLSPGVRRSVVCAIASADFGRLTGAASGWFDPNFLGRLYRSDAGPRRALFAIAQEMSAPAFARDIAIEGHTLVLFSEIARLMIGNDPRPWEGRLARHELETLEEMVHEQLAGDLSIANLAAELRLSPRHLARSFRQSTGMTVREYIEGIRLQKVVELLTSTGLPLKVIAPRVGLASGNYLSTAFSRRMGVSPSEYRRRLRSAH